MMKEEQIRQNCWDNSLMNIGTSYIFARKAKKYKVFIRTTTILGLLVPLLLGTTVAAYGQNSSVLTLAIVITAPIVVLQIVLSCISLILKWDDLFAYSLESQTENRVLSEQYQKLAKYSNANIEELKRQFDILEAKNNARTAQDEKITFTNKEKRIGMRYGLYILKRECAICKKIPQSLTPTDCNTCGNY